MDYEELCPKYQNAWQRVQFLASGIKSLRPHCMLRPLKSPNAAQCGEPVPNARLCASWL